jgi:hypothetical protein
MNINMRVSIGWVLALILAWSAEAGAQIALLVSGQTSIATIDVDNDGPDSGDCQFSAFIGGILSGNPTTAILTIEGNQSNLPLLRACQLEFTGTASKGTDSSSNFVAASITGATGPMGFNFPDSLPFDASLYDETPNLDINAPVRLNDGADLAEVVDSVTSQTVFGRICSAAGGAAAQVFSRNSPMLMVDLPLHPNSGSPTHLKIPGPPLSFDLDGGGSQQLNAYVPLTSDGHLTVSRSDAPSVLLLDINLNALPDCAAAAPTLSGVILIAIALSLMAGGALVLSRRRGFARALSF